MKIGNSLGNRFQKVIAPGDLLGERDRTLPVHPFVEIPDATVELNPVAAVIVFFVVDGATAVLLFRRRRDRTAAQLPDLGGINAPVQHGPHHDTLVDLRQAVGDALGDQAAAVYPDVAALPLKLRVGEILPCLAHGPDLNAAGRLDVEDAGFLAKAFGGQDAGAEQHMDVVGCGLSCPGFIRWVMESDIHPPRRNRSTSHCAIGDGRPPAGLGAQLVRQADIDLAADDRVMAMRLGAA